MSLGTIEFLRLHLLCWSDTCGMCVVGARVGLGQVCDGEDGKVGVSVSTCGRQRMGQFNEKCVLFTSLEVRASLISNCLSLGLLKFSKSDRLISAGENLIPESLTVLLLSQKVAGRLQMGTS